MEFVASFITLLGAAGKTSKVLYELYLKMKDAPSDIQELTVSVKSFHHLLTEIEAQVRGYHSIVPTQDSLQNLWGTSLDQMRRDVQSLEALVSKVELLAARKSWTMKMTVPIRKIFDEKKTAKHQKRIEAHCNVLRMIQAMAIRQVHWPWPI